jgi:diacylglycerol kinase (ATP)
LAKRCFMIVNPTSGSYSQQKVDRIVEALRQEGLDAELLPTTGPLDATLFASRICAEEQDPLIVVAGGDGTVNGVLNGLAPGVARLGVIPLGTSNVLARELNIRSVADAVKRLVRGETRPVPVGELQCAGQNRRFILMAGVGVDGAVVRDVRLAEKRAVGKGAYVLSALRLLFSWDRDLLQVEADGKRFSCHSVIVCNASKYGGNFLLAAKGDIFSPGFQVICVTGGPLAYLKLCWLLALGKVAPSRSVAVFAASELEVSGGKAVQLDGDFFGCAPLRLRTVPDFLRLVV